MRTKELAGVIRACDIGHQELCYMIDNFVIGNIPTLEEIEEERIGRYPEYDGIEVEYRDCFKAGAKWVITEILSKL